MDHLAVRTDDRCRQDIVGLATRNCKPRSLFDVGASCDTVFCVPTPSPLFLDLFITKGLKPGDFGSVHSEGVADAIHGSAHSKGVTRNRRATFSVKLIERRARLGLERMARRVGVRARMKLLRLAAGRVRRVRCAAEGRGLVGGAAYCGGGGWIRGPC